MTIFVEFELAEDTKDLLVSNSDVVCSDVLKDELEKMDDSQLVKVEYTINSPLTILSIIPASDWNSV